MRSVRFLLVAAALWVAPPSVAEPVCGPVNHDGARYTVCTARADRDDLRLWHSDAEGRLYGGFTAVDRALADEGLTLGFAMNGGMYHEDRAPVGLYIEESEERAPIVTRDGPGNFGLLPNGVFCLSGDGRAAVTESRRFQAQAPRCRFASQSGPMLVIDGALHPRFLADGTSKHIRNGVGVAADGVTVHFAISDERVNFHQFGRLFRDALGVPNALYFDGKVSRLHAPGLGRSDVGFAPLGPIVGAAVPRG